METTLVELEGPRQEKLRRSVCANVKREVLQELHNSKEEKSESSVLRPGAPVFCPPEMTADPVATDDRAAGGSGTRLVQRPGPYDGEFIVVGVPQAIEDASTTQPQD